VYITAVSRTIPTYCRICEAACGLLAEVDEDGQVVRLRPDPEHPSSQGFVCAKGTRFAEVANHPTRLLYPQERLSDGRLLRVSWRDAMKRAGSELRDIIDNHGPNAVAIYIGNPVAFNALGAISALSLGRALGTRNVFGAGSQDCNNKFAGSRIVHGSPVIHPIPDLENAELAVMFGTNPAVSQSSFVHLTGGSLAFDRMKSRGGRTIWVDPRRTESAERWGEHLSIRPGADVWLLLALLRILGRGRADDESAIGLNRLLAVASEITPERAAKVTGISAQRIKALARDIAETDRVTLHISVGVNQGPFGTLAYVVLQALAYVTGNLDAAGGLLFHPWAPIAADLARRGGVDARGHRSRIGNFTTTMDTLPGAILADEILTEGPGRIRALIVLSGDPVRSIPGGDRLADAVASLDLLISVDLFENATGSTADLLLPATSWLERWDLATTTLILQTTGLVQWAGPVTDPPGETRSDFRILADLSAAAGRPLFGSSMVTRALGRLPWDRVLGGVSRGLRASLGRFSPTFRHGLPAPEPQPGTYVGRGPRTPGHVLRFWHPDLEPEAARLEAVEQTMTRANGRDFLLMGRRRRIGHNGWLHGGTRGGRSDGSAWLHPDDMKRLGLSDGDQVQIETDAAEVTVPVRGRAQVAPRTVVFPHGLEGANVNALIPSGVEFVEAISGQHWMTGIPASVQGRS
jgi:formate dehydrogenase